MNRSLSIQNFCIRIADMDRFAERLEMARNALGISKYELAKRMDVRASNVGGWTNGEYKPSWDQMPLLAAQLGVKISWLLGEDENDPVPISPELAMQIVNGEIQQAKAVKKALHQLAWTDEMVAKFADGAVDENLALMMESLQMGVAVPEQAELAARNDKKKRGDGGNNKKKGGKG
jgi:transcriptional regulator with XRE-family HTH domain